MSELTVLQAIRLKGRPSEQDLLATLDEDATDVTSTLAQLHAAGLLTEGKRLRISPEGRARLNVLLEQERLGIDQNTLAHAYADFRQVNNEFKALVSAWQIKDGRPNTHDDAEYDAATLKRLENVHQQVLPVIATVTTVLPRLSAYAAKLNSALDKFRAGESIWFTRPMIDSYHTVWFELHEELIGASGLSREEEAKAGHAD